MFHDCVTTKNHGASDARAWSPRMPGFLLALFVCGLTAVAPAGASAGTLDQSQPTSDESFVSLGGGRSQAQTFTAGIDGQLDKVDLLLSRGGDPGDLTVQVRAASGGVPSTTVLASATVPQASVPSGAAAWVSVALSPTAPSSAGTQYAIVLSAPGGDMFTPYHWQAQRGDPYTGGGLATHDSGATWESLSADAVFKTYVAAANEPFAFGGFATPIDAGELNSAKAGQTIPVKWHLEQPDGTPVSDPASFTSLTSQNAGGSCSGQASDAIETYSGDSGLQYLGNGDWQYNWKTPKTYTGQCRTMSLTLADDSTHTASFQFK